MADRIAANADLVVDELKRKARRRLVGAIVLALAAAVILPLLLEKEPRPLGDDVSVQIPPIDDGKFVNRLTGTAGETKADDKAAPKGAAASAESKMQPAGAAAPAASAPAASGPIEPAAPKKPVAEAEPRVLAPPAKAETRPAPAPEPAPVAAPAKTDAFVVQLAAYADDKGANALANKLKKVGYAAYVEPVQTSRGTLWRVRVRGFESRSEADAARVKLKGEGYSGIVTPSK